MKIVQRARGADFEHLLSFHLHRHVAGGRPGRALKRIHASDVTEKNWCPRRHALYLATETNPPDEFLGTSRNLAYEVSSAMARTVIRWAADAGIARGDWSCLRCGKMSNYGPRPITCDCGADRFWYHEHRFRSAVSGISGGMDLGVALPHLTKHRIVELKAYADDGFKKMKKPMPEHLKRTNLYLRLIEESDDPVRHQIDTKKAIILYMTKGGFGVKKQIAEWGIRDIPWSPFKEFTISRDDEETEEMSVRATSLTEWMAGGETFPGGICKSNLDSIAQKCPMHEVCFSGKF